MSRTIRPTDYTRAELTALAQHWPVSSAADVRAALPNRTWGSLRKQAQAQRLFRPAPGKWTLEHEAILRAHYPTGGAVLVGELLGRDRPTVSDKAYQMGVRYVGKLGPAEHRTTPTKVRKPKQRTAKQRLADERREARAQKLFAPKPQAPKPVKVAKPRAERPGPKVFVAAPTPQAPKPASSRTPNLNAAKAQRIAAEKQDKAKQAKLAIVPATEIAKLPYTHPARMAYTVNARHGGAAASQAYHQVMSTLK